jgi:hypothetical protein
MTNNIPKSTFPSPRPRAKFIREFPSPLPDDIIIQMNDAMLTWLAGQQVQDAEHQYYRAIWYPSERRYDNRDTGCAALAFWRLFQKTGDEKFLHQAQLAKEYVLDVQEEDGGYAELTKDNARMDEGSTVNTGTIAMSLIRAFEAGFECTKRDLTALSRMADFLLTLEWIEGGFYHDENHLYKKSRMDCQNTTALAAASLCHIDRLLTAHNFPTKPVWKEAATRSIERLLQGQDASGQWPYRLGMIDTYPCDMNHHGMLMLMVGELYRIFPDPRLLDALTLGGQWLVEDAFLQTPHGTKHNWAFQRSACLYFTAGYFFTSSALAQLAVLDKSRHEFWNHHARELLRYVRTDLWDNPQYETEGPFRLTEAGLAPGYAWHGQAMGWCTYLMDHVLADLGLLPT